MSFEYAPGGQSLQLDVPFGAAVPAQHGWQMDNPDEYVALPPGQDVHVDATAPEYLPDGHKLQMYKPGTVAA